MRLKFLGICVLLLCILVSFSIAPFSVEGNYQKTYNFQTQYGFFGQKLYLSIQPSLYVHYSNMTHALTSDADYAQYVTPQAVAPIADCLLQMTQDLPNADEQFANAVLSLVHQIPYNITGVQYPVEAIIQNQGDCVALSLLAASIMQAGGLDVVLIHYTGINPSHLNVGVYLPNTPVYHNILTSAKGYEYGNKTYWTGEATPESDWKLGDQADQLAVATPEIIPLNNTEQVSPGQVAASFDAQPLPSTINLNLLEQPLSVQNITRGFLISGSISPALANQSVAIYITQNQSLANYYQASTDYFGNYSFTWNFTSIGTYFVTASWGGGEGYAGADSETLTIFVGPPSVLQFGTPDYNYILTQTNMVYYLLGPASTLNYTLPALQGVNNFLTIPLQTNVSLSYSFLLLQTGHEAVNFSSKTIPLKTDKGDAPQTWPPTRLGTSDAVEVSNQTQNVPTNIPDGMGPLTIPGDFNQTINNHFCFLLQNNGADNYCLDAKALDTYDLINLTESSLTGVALLNASDNIKANSWYYVTQTMFNNRITTQIRDENGTMIETISTPSNTLALLVANNMDNAVIFKNLQYSSIDSQPQKSQSSPLSDPPASTLSDEWFLFIVLVTLLAVSGISLALAYSKGSAKVVLPRVGAEDAI
jgi:hypothetical protein